MGHSYTKPLKEFVPSTQLELPQNLQKLSDAVRSCHLCQLAKTRLNTVFGEGNESAKLMFVGEGPGESEDKSGRPFVGKAGELLTKMIENAIGAQRESVYIANIVKCRPPKNRDPQPLEQESCEMWLREQVRLMRPKIIVCLGRIAAQKIISPDFKVTKQHGEFFERKGTLLMGTFHPAALLRNPNNKPAALSDFLALRDKINEICERTY